MKKVLKGILQAFALVGLIGFIGVAAFVLFKAVTRIHAANEEGERDNRLIDRYSVQKDEVDRLNKTYDDEVARLNKLYGKETAKLTDCVAQKRNGTLAELDDCLSSNSKPASDNTFPIKKDMIYSEARNLLLKAGWVGVSNPDDLRGMEKETFDQGYNEVEACAGDSEVCAFEFKNPLGDSLKVFAMYDYNKNGTDMGKAKVAGWDFKPAATPQPDTPAKNTPQQ